MPDRNINQRYDFARHIAWEAGRLTLRYFDKENVAVDRKADTSPVTVADREAELLLREHIRREFPEDGIVGEEFGEDAGTSGYRWIVDPIDGTKSFISGVPLYGTLVGVECAGRSIIGVIALPALQIGVDGARGQGAWQTWPDRDRSPARVSPIDKLREGVLVTTDVAGFIDRNAEDAFHELCGTAWYARTWGDCYGYFLVATGRALAMIDPAMNLWDAAAVQPILEEAGGTFSDWCGQPTITAGEGLATNKLVLDEILAVTRRFCE
jgi:histidinol phosphatase-like enzyme (inositol monophosphatase family)